MHELKQGYLLEEYISDLDESVTYSYQNNKKYIISFLNLSPN